MAGRFKPEKTENWLELVFRQRFTDQYTTLKHGCQIELRERK